MAARSAMLVVGDINVDVLARLGGELEAGGDNIASQSLELQLGGVGANVAVTLAKWGVGARLAGCVGRDAFGDFAQGALARHGVDVRAVARVDAPTGLFVVPVEPGGRRTVIGARGANESAPALSASECLAHVSAVHLVGYTLLSGATAAWLRGLVHVAGERRIPVSLDVGHEPSRAARDAVLELARQVDTLLVAQDEAEALTCESGEAARAAIARCGAHVVILKQGAAGCQFTSDGRWWKIAPLEVNVVDTTGAGDAFAAGYWVARLRGWDTGDAVSLANACGAAAATVLGAGEAMPGPAGVMRVLERQETGGPETSATARLRRLLRTEARPARA
ncbi:MAG: carbohydrate kinase family protein [Candidatus Acidiferrales bacterium]